MIVCLMTIVLSANAQKSSEFSYMEYQKPIAADDTYIPTKEQTPSVMLAGKYLKMSANFEIASICSAAASAGLAILAANKSHDDKSREFYTGMSIVFGGLAATCYIAKIGYKWKSGKTLELCGNGVRLTF